MQLRIPFQVDANGDIAIMSDPAAIDRANMVTLVSTQVGERAMRPTYGVATQALLFGDADYEMAQSVVTEIKNAVSMYAPELEFVDASVQPASEEAFNEGRVEVAVAYRPARGRLDTGVATVTTSVVAGG